MMATKPVPGFTEDWFCDLSRDTLAALTREVAHIDGAIIEIGSWEGRSSCVLANAAHPRIVDCVDTWAGSPDEISSSLAAERDVHAQWLANIDAYTAGNVRAHRMGWRDYVPTITTPVALAFIDAEHSYQEVHDNIVALRPHMAPGGIMCGDDVSHPPVRQAVADILNPHRVWVKATLWIWRVPK